MTQRERRPGTVDIACAQCGKPMMMLSFNYTTLEKGFESISLRCQYCKAEETRPWREPEGAGDESSAPETQASEPHHGGDFVATNEIEAPTTELDSGPRPEGQPSTLDPSSSGDADLIPDDKPAP